MSTWALRGDERKCDLHPLRRGNVERRGGLCVLVQLSSGDLFVWLGSPEWLKCLQTVRSRKVCRGRGILRSMRSGRGVSSRIDVVYILSCGFFARFNSFFL